MTRNGAVSALAFALAIVASACTTGPRAGVTHGAAAPVVAAPVTGETGTDDTDADDETDDDETDGEPEVDSAEPAGGPCRGGMALVDAGGRRFCIDKYEASLVELGADGSERPYPHYLPVDGHDVRAVSVPSVFPQGFISEVQAEDACAASQKRLCRPEEWKTACMGPSKTTFPYGEARRPGVCHDDGKSAVLAVFGAKAVAASMPGPAITQRASSTAASAPASSPKGTKGKRASGSKHATKPRAGSAQSAAKTTSMSTSASTTASAKAPRKRRGHAKQSARPASVDPGVWAKLNDPALGQVEGALAKTGSYGECVNGFGVFDMVGNLHEWVATDASVPHGTFAGGYYLDTAQNGDGCNYRTVAHAHDYHDYSTGFRCCADADR
jgi:hypothetical protein